MKIGAQTYLPQRRAFISLVADIAGSDEALGNLREYIDTAIDCGEWGCSSHEKTETRMREEIIRSLLERRGSNLKTLIVLWAAILSIR